MKIGQAKTLLKEIFAYNLGAFEKGKSPRQFIVPFFVGDPGVGKTAIPRQVAEELGVFQKQVIVAQYDAGEMAGLPFMDKYETPVRDEIGNPLKAPSGETVMESRSRMIRLRPNYLPDIDDEEERIGIFNLDELPQAFLANLNICSQIVNEWRVGEHLISPGITMCCTGNKPENKAGTTTLPMHLRDRLMFVEIETDLDEWLAYAATYGVDPRIRSFLRQHPKALHDFNVGVNAFPSPRSWEKASGILSMELDKVIRYQALSGTIGEGATKTLETYLRVEDRLPKLEDIIKDPEGAPVFGNTDADVLYMLLANLADRSTKENVGNIIKYINRLPNQEFAAYYIFDLVKAHPEVKKVDAVIKWLYSKGTNLLL